MVFHHSHKSNKSRIQKAEIYFIALDNKKQTSVLKCLLDRFSGCRNRQLMIWFYRKYYCEHLVYEMGVVSE